MNLFIELHQDLMKMLLDAGVDDPVLSKINTGRPKDKADIDMLQRIDKARQERLNHDLPD